MKTVFSLLILIFSYQAYSCELSEKIVSLSGPITMVLEELDLLGDKNLLAVSKFHPIKNITNAKVLAGGLFLSKKTLKKYQHTKIFFDKSRELKILLSKDHKGLLVEVDTRDQSPFEAFNLSLVKTMNSLKNCHKKVEALEKKILKIKKYLSIKHDFHKSVFYLGSIGTKFPDMVISNDGFILSLKNNINFKTYPSELAYSTWSKKIMKSLSGFKHFGVVESKEDNLRVIKVSGDKYNLSMRGILTPGIRQIYFLDQFQSLQL
jgi:hypothetical protein